MRITIESTDKLTEIGGVTCRVWRGVTERGVECDLAIPLLRVAYGADARQFDRELGEMPAPTEPPVSFKRIF
jgi:hypothetical protein